MSGMDNVVMLRSYCFSRQCREWSIDFILLSCRSPHFRLRLVGRSADARSITGAADAPGIRRQSTDYTMITGRRCLAPRSRLPHRHPHPPNPSPPFLAAHRAPRHSTLPAVPPRHASRLGRARTATPSAAAVNPAAFAAPATPITELRRRAPHPRSPWAHALTTVDPSAIVRPSPLAPWHATRFDHARLAAYRAVPAAAFNSQAQPLAR